MITIVNPKEHIANLLGKRDTSKDDIYRLMRYVMRVDYQGKVLLHNVVTGELVLLDEFEEKVLDDLSSRYDECMTDLIAHYFLVPNTHDEHEQVVKLRSILRKVANAQASSEITSYCILPTTACNARCYYCFEQGCETVTMTKQTAIDTVSFITRHCGNKAISIMWFGGEPTVASHRIDEICEGLRDKKVVFKSTIITNGYLLDKEMVQRAKELWNLKHAQIAFDGTEETYNSVKSYVYHDASPYKRVMDNIGYMLDAGIAVGLRMNFDLSNRREFKDLVSDALDRFHGNSLLHVYAYPVIGEYMNTDGVVLHGDDAWIAESQVELNDFSRMKGAYNSKRPLPSLRYSSCAAGRSDAVTITPKGLLVRCPEHFDDAQATGSVKEGLEENEVFKSWRTLSDFPRCRSCSFFPDCARLLNCSAKDHCYHSDRNRMYELEAMRQYEAWVVDRSVAEEDI